VGWEAWSEVPQQIADLCEEELGIKA